MAEVSYVRAESGRVFRETYSPGSLVVDELVDGRWVTPSGPVFLGNLMEGERLSEEEVANLVRSGT